MCWCVVVATSPLCVVCIALAMNYVVIIIYMGREYKMNTEPPHNQVHQLNMLQVILLLYGGCLALLLLLLWALKHLEGCPPSCVWQCNAACTTRHDQDQTTPHPLQLRQRCCCASCCGCCMLCAELHQQHCWQGTQRHLDACKPEQQGQW